MTVASCIKRESSDGYEAVHARNLHRFPDLVATLGGDPHDLMARAGIRDDTDQRITYRHLARLMEISAAELDCPDFGMRLAQLQGGGLFGPLGSVMRNSRTFGEAIDYVCSHSYVHSLAARIARMQRVEDGRVFMSHDILLDGIAHRGQLMEQILLVGHLTAMEMTAGHARAWQVHFRHQPVSSAKTYRRNFGCEVLFGQNQDGVVYTDRSLDSPIIGPDTETYRQLTAFIDENFVQHVPPLHARVRGIILRRLDSECCTSDRIAGELHLHIRTLHRKLREEGTTFQRIKDQVRRDLMLYYLKQTDLDFSYISGRLGFAEQSVFTRSCIRWLAGTPTLIRSAMRV